ncbi:MAG TPA: cytochrome c peroxidase [Reyranella sp.]|nr:cytochrome c peroxidase [Reyranella sp.]
MKRLVVLALLVLPLPAALPAASPSSPALIGQGRALFNDPKLSASGQISCATCHPMNGHTDNKTYVGLDIVADGDPKGRSTPTSPSCSTSTRRRTTARKR